jgi:hypothetical protein
MNKKNIVKGRQHKKNFILKVFEMMPHGTLKILIVFWAFKPTFAKNTYYNMTWFLLFVNIINHQS